MEKILNFTSFFISVSFSEEANLPMRNQTFVISSKTTAQIIYLLFGSKYL